MDVAALTARVTADTRDFESGIARAGSQWAGFVKDVGGGAASLSSTLTRGLTLGIGAAAGMAGLHGLSDVFSSAQDAVIGFNSQLQKSSITFTAFAGSVELSQQFLGQLKELAATSPFEFQDVLTGAQRFAGMGLAMDKIIPIMKDVSVVAQAMGAGAAQINSINLAISQVVARGKVSAQEMNQLANAGIPAWTILAGAMNKTVGEVMKLAEQGDISAADFLNAFDKAAHDPKLQALGEAMNKSFDTAASNVHDRVQFMVADIGKPIFEMATDVANGLANILNTPVIQGLGQGLAAMIQDMVDALRPLGDAFNAAFAKLQTGDLQGALGGMLDSINGFARQMFGAGYTLVTTMANGMLSGLGAVVSAAADIATTIAGFLIGNSPPPMGPLKEIEAGGTNLMNTYVAGMQGGLGGLDAVTQGVADSFAKINAGASLADGRAGLQAAAGNAAMLKTEAADAGSAIQQLDGLMHELEGSSRATKFAADDLKSSYEDQIQPLEDAADAILHQNDLLDKQLDIADRLKGAELKRAAELASGSPVEKAKLQAQIDGNNEKLKEMRLAQSEADLEKQIAEARKNKKDTGSLQARLAELQIQKQNAELEKQQAGLVDKTGLAQIKQQQAIQKEEEDRRRTEQEIRKLQAEQTAAPMLAQVQKLKAEEQARLKPLEDQLKIMDRQRAVIQAERQDWQELRQDITAANAEIEKAHKAAAGGATAGGGLAGLNIASQPIAAVNAAAENLAKNFGEKFKSSIDAWFKSHGGELQGGIAGAIVGGVAFGPLGALVGGMFGQALVKSLTEKFPNIGAIVQEKMGTAAFAVEAFGKILQGQGQYLVAFRVALETLVPPEVAGAITQVTATVARMIPEVQTAIAGGIPGISAQLLLWGNQFVAWVAPAIPRVLLELGILKDQALAWVRQQAPGWLVALQNWATQLWTWIAPKIPVVLAELGKLKDQAFAWIRDNAPAWKTTWETEWGPGLYSWIPLVIPKLLETLEKDYKTPFANWLKDNAGFIAYQWTLHGTEALGGLAKALIDGAPKFIELGATVAKNFIEGFGAAVKDMLGGLIQQIIDDWIKAHSHGPGPPAPFPASGTLRASFNPNQNLQGIMGDAGPVTQEALDIMRTGGTGNLKLAGDALLKYVQDKFTEALGPEAGRAAAAVALTEGGLHGAPGDYAGNDPTSFGVFQFHGPGGQLDAFAQWLNTSLADAADIATNRPDVAVQYALQNYLGQAIQNGLAMGLTGPDLATFAQRTGQVSVSPERAGQSYQSLYGEGGTPPQTTVDLSGGISQQNMLLSSTTALLPVQQDLVMSTTQLSAAQQSGVQAAANSAIAQRALGQSVSANVQVTNGAVAPTVALAGAQQDNGRWAKQMADEQAALNATLAQQVPPGRAATEAMQNLGSVLGPVERQIAAGTITGDTLRGTMLDLAKSTGLASQPWADFATGVKDSGAAMDELINATAGLSPEFQAVVEYQKTAGSSANTAAIMWEQAAQHYAAAKETLAKAPDVTSIANAITGAAGNVVGGKTGPSPIDVQGAAFDALKPKIELASTALTGYQTIVQGLDPSKLAEQAGAWDSVTEAIGRASEGVKQFGDYLDHDFKLKVDVSDVPDWLIPHSPPPLVKGLYQVADAFQHVNRMSAAGIGSSLGEMSLRPEVPPVASSGGGGSTTTVVNNYYVTVEGNIATEQQFVDRFHNGLLAKKRRNGGLRLGDKD